MTAQKILSATLAAFILTACGERDIILPGERIDVRPSTAVENEVRALNLPAQVDNKDWTHRNGGADHAITHPVLGTTLARAFTADIGAGNSLRARITSDPVVAGGVIYTLDARSQVTATSTAGATLWAADVSPRVDGGNDASGGGLAVADARVFVTTGFGELTVLDAATGAESWTQDLDAPAGSAPTVFGDLVYVVSRNSVAWAIDVETGRVRWQLSGTPSVGNFAGGAGVAVNSEIAVFPFPSGEVLGAFPKGGLQRWSNVVTGERLGSAAAKISDIAADPVIDGDVVYAGNVSGRLVAMDVASGDRRWTSSEGAVSPVWASGGSVFLVNDINELVRLDASNGTPVWRVDLPNVIERRFGSFQELHANYGPVLAGGRLIVASSDGVIRQFDPTSGALIGTLELPAGAASNPVVAGGTLYVVNKDGQLVAFR